MLLPYSRCLQTFLSVGHICCYTILWGPIFLRNVIVSGKVAFHQITNFSSIYCFFIIDKMALRAGWNFFYWPHLAQGRSLETPAVQCSALISTALYIHLLEPGLEFGVRQKVLCLSRFHLSSGPAANKRKNWPTSQQKRVNCSIRRKKWHFCSLPSSLLYSLYTATYC